MKPKWQKLASMAQEICTLLFQFFGAVFASKGYPFKNIFNQIVVSGSFLPSPNYQNKNRRLLEAFCNGVARTHQRETTGPSGDSLQLRPF